MVRWKSTRREFLNTSAAAALFARTSRAVAVSRIEPRLRIGLVADAQYADSDTKGTRFYRNSIEKLGAAVEDFNRRELAFCVHLGDLIDHTWKSFDEIMQPLKNSRHAFHHLLGNHDFDVPDEFKPNVPARMGMKHRYAFFDQAGFRFVILDTNDLSTYAHSAKSPESAASAAELKRLKDARVPQAQPYNGGLSAKQLKWFDESCRTAGEAKLKVIVFAHHPAFPAAVHNLWNSSDLLAVIDRHRHVVAFINGHNHAGDFAVHNGVPFVTMHGMVETDKTTAYAAATLHDDRIVIEGTGREPSRELVFRT